MASTFTMTVNKIIEKALRRLGVIGEGEETTSEMYNSALEDLNLINISLNQYDKRLWAMTEQVIDLTEPDSRTNGGATYYCIKNHTSSADTEPGTGDDWELYWRLGSTSEDNPIAWVIDTEYVNGATEELEANIMSINDAYVRYSGEDKQLTLINKYNRSEIVDKGQLGGPLELYFDPKATIPTVYVYPLPDNDYKLVINTIRLQDDIAGQGSTPDIPPEWYNFLIFALAYAQGYEYGINSEKLAILKGEASVELRKNLVNVAEVADHNFCKPCY